MMVRVRATPNFCFSCWLSNSRRRQTSSRIEAVRAAVAQFGAARDLPKTYYSQDLVQDQLARREWVPPDKSSF